MVVSECTVCCRVVAYHTLALPCQSVLRATAEVIGKVGNSTPAPPKTPEPIVAKICMGDYVGDIYPYAKFHNDPITPLCPPNVRKFAWSDSASFFFLGSSDNVPPRPLHRFLRSIRQMTSFRARMCLFGGLENKNVYFEPIFPKNRKILGNFWRDFEIFGSKRP